MVAILTRGVANLPGLLSRRTRPFASTKRFKLLHMPQPPFTLKFGLAILPMYNPCHKVVQILIWVSSCGTSISTWPWGFVIPPPLPEKTLLTPLALHAPVLSSVRFQDGRQLTFVPEHLKQKSRGTKCPSVSVTNMIS